MLSIDNQYMLQLKTKNELLYLKNLYFKPQVENRLTFN